MRQVAKSAPHNHNLQQQHSANNVTVHWLKMYDLWTHKYQQQPPYQPTFVASVTFIFPHQPGILDQPKYLLGFRHKLVPKENI